MKITLLTIIAISLSLSVNAKTINSSKETINPSAIEKIVRLVDKNNESTYKKLQIVVEDTGLSTDVSPRYKIYLGYASLAEMGNISTNFILNDQAFKFLSAERKSAGVYEIKVVEYRTDVTEPGMYIVTQTIDATKVFADEQKIRIACGDDFCDQELNSSIEITETAILE